MYSRHAGMSRAGSPHDAASICLVYYIMLLVVSDVTSYSRRPYLSILLSIIYFDSSVDLHSFSAGSWIGFSEGFSIEDVTPRRFTPRLTPRTDSTD